MEKTDQVLGSTQTTKTSRGEDEGVSGNQEHTDGLHGHLGDVANFASLSGSTGEESIDESYGPTDHEASYDEEQDPDVGNDGNDIPPESTGINSLGYSAERGHQQVANVNKVKTHQIGFICASRFLSPEQAERIGKNLEEIDRITDEETVEALTVRGALPPSFKSTENNLMANGINPSLLTTKEAERLDDYVEGKTPEIQKRKIEEIINSIHRMRNTTRSRRNFEGSNLGGQFDQLITLAERYEKGEFDDPEGNFDVNIYLVSRYSAYNHREMGYSTGREFDDDYDRDYDGYGASYHSLFKDAGAQSDLERAIEDGATIEDLINEGLISEDQIPVMGPFTEQDLDGVEVFQKLLWAEPDARTDKEVRDLLSTTVKGVGLQEQLAQRYVAEEFLPKRRLGPKNLLLLTASMGKDYFRLLGSIPEDEAKIIKEKLSRASFYLGRAMLVSSDSIKDTYGSTRPVTEQFFDDVIDYANSLSERRESMLNQDINAYLAKLDGWVFEIEALFEPYAVEENGEKSEASNQFGLPSELTIDGGE